MNNYEIEKYVVGEKFGRDIGGEGCIFETHDNLCEMIISLRNPRKKEIRAVERGTAKFVLSVVKGVIFLCVSFDESLYYEVPFNMALYKEFQLKEPGNNGYLMPIFLVDYDTNEIVAMRAIGFTNEFSKKLFQYSKEQWNNPIKEYNHKLDCLLDEYPMGEIAKSAVAINRFGGVK